ncbi:MAG TPA: hypothetical protein VGH74_01935 [Planctomycetaceae bacterium]|jgi:hypothetical protein
MLSFFLPGTISLAKMTILRAGEFESFNPEPGTIVKSDGPTPATVRYNENPAVGRERTPGKVNYRDRK